MFRKLVALKRLAKQLWVRVALFAVLAIVSVLFSHLAAGLVPDEVAARIGPDAVTPILSILASSMLAVSTFSLATMVSAHFSAAGSTTPRVMRLLTADSTTQTVLAIFIGAFVFALTALILFYAGYDSGAALVLGVTLWVTGAVVLALIRWIAHLTALGTMGDVLQRTETTAKNSLTNHRRRPALGAQSLGADIIMPDDAKTLRSPKSGVLQMIDVAGLARCSTTPVFVLRRPGQVVLHGAPLAQFSGDVSAEALLSCFVIGESRTFEQDPAFAMTVLSEVALRALSPAVNDPGTAIDVISRLERLLWDWAHGDGPDSVSYPLVYVPVLCAEDLVNASFDAIARDGAALYEVCAHLLDALNALAQSEEADLAVAAQALAHRARAHAQQAMRLEDDVLRLPPARE
ncbi:DUF2254 domain-containing protein [Pararhodobacter sp.]|uniref:DUF2254 domain-containing protein n=1 Tax=Pararhodobacter sp. TaxID=2127056 RepID=UPI002AFE7737|nr:DUF2254 domain-containing protein [Pararhodobacter sp.]